MQYKNVEIKEPEKISEFEVQAWLFASLKDVGINVRGEVIVHTGLNISGYKVARFDLVVFKEGKAAMIIEVKDKMPRKGVNQDSRQFKKYSSFGLPLYYVHGKKIARNFFDSLVNGKKAYPLQPEHFNFLKAKNVAKA